MNRNKKFGLESQVMNVKNKIQKLKEQDTENKEICECVEILAQVVDLILSEF